jgi:ferredoxin
LIPHVDYGRCVGCGACAELYPSFFVMRDEKAWVINHEKFSLKDDGGVLYCCPFHAITVE